MVTSACPASAGEDRGEGHKNCRIFPKQQDIVSFTMKDRQNLVQTDGIDLITLGQRLRHLRRARGLTLTELGERLGRAPSTLSLLENGRRGPSRPPPRKKPGSPTRRCGTPCASGTTTSRSSSARRPLRSAAEATP